MTTEKQLVISPVEKARTALIVAAYSKVAGPSTTYEATLSRLTPELDALVLAVAVYERELHGETVIAVEGDGIAPDEVLDGYSYGADLVRRKLAAVAAHAEVKGLDSVEEDARAAYRIFRETEAKLEQQLADLTARSTEEISALKAQLDQMSMQQMSDLNPAWMRGFEYGRSAALKCEHCEGPLTCDPMLREALAGEKHLCAQALQRAEHAETQLLHQGWQNIATAPRDATRVLVFVPATDQPRREVFEAWWAIPYEGAPIDQGWWCYDGDKTMLSADVHRAPGGRPLGATMWRPMPVTPSQADEDGGVAMLVDSTSEHRCAWCGQSIAAGLIHGRFIGQWEGLRQDWRMHVECYLFSEKEGALGAGFTLYQHERPDAPRAQTTDAISRATITDRDRGAVPRAGQSIVVDVYDWRHGLSAEQTELRRGAHLAHCYQGEESRGCKYGNSNCPAAPPHLNTPPSRAYVIQELQRLAHNAALQEHTRDQRALVNAIVLLTDGNGANS